MSHILLVDDDPDVLYVLTAAFESAGHRVRATPDPVAAGPIAREDRFDAVVLDVTMPGRSGWEVLEELRGNPRTKRMPVLMLSSTGDAANRVRGIRLGADDFLTKPFHCGEILARVERLVDRRSSRVSGLQGELSILPLSELLQSLVKSRASGLLEVAASGGDGRLRFADGRCLGAVFDGLDGNEAVVALLKQRDGTFRLVREPWTADSKLEVESLPLSRLMLEAVWIQDELRARLALLPPEDHGLLTANDVLAPASPAGLPELPLEPILSLLHDRPGASLSELLAARLAAPDRVRLAVAWLIESRLVAAAGPTSAP
jgi:CheY-like chemotaxis protein